MDKITFDFEKELFCVENDEVKFEQYIPGLKDSKNRILADAGIMMMDAAGMSEVIRSFQEGNLDQDEFIEKILETVLDHVKSQYHDALN